MKIVVDAMGSDNCPAPDVAGGLLAARELGVEIVLVGDEALISAELAKLDSGGVPVTVQHASERITMDDKPSDILRGKADSSMHVGMRLVKEGQADAFVSAGNTGAIMAVAMLATLKRIRGVKRPALGAIFPFQNRPLLLDVGANADVKADTLAQFALMGSIYSELGADVNRPRVALLSNGEEEGKGNELVRETDALLRASDLNFIGNIEPKQFMRGGADVIVADGFAGNIMLKSIEATASTLLGLVRDEIMASTRTKLGGALARPAFNRVRTVLNPDQVGGAPLLGINGVVIVAHGSSSPLAIRNAVQQAKRAVERDVVGAITRGVAKT